MGQEGQEGQGACPSYLGGKAEESAGVRKAVTSGAWRWCLGQEGWGSPEERGGSGDTVQEQGSGGLWWETVKCFMWGNSQGQVGWKERAEVWEANVGWKEEESSGKRTMGVRNKKG